MFIDGNTLYLSRIDIGEVYTYDNLKGLFPEFPDEICIKIEQENIKYIVFQELDYSLISRICRYTKTMSMWEKNDNNSNTTT